MTSSPDTILRDICEGKLSQSAIHGYSQDDLERIASLGYAEINGEGVWCKVLPTDAGKAFLAAGGFTAAQEKELAQKRQDEFQEFQRKFMDCQREMLEEQHRHSISQGNKMLVVSMLSAAAAMLSATATVFTAFDSCSDDIRKEQRKSGYDNEQKHCVQQPAKHCQCPLKRRLP